MFLEISLTPLVTAYPLNHLQGHQQQGLPRLQEGQDQLPVGQVEIFFSTFEATQTKYHCRQSLSLIMTTMIIGFSQFVINILLPSTDAFTRIRAVNERQVSHCPEKALKDSSRVLFWALCNFANVR